MDTPTFGFHAAIVDDGRLELAGNDAAPSG